MQIETHDGGLFDVSLAECEFMITVKNMIADVNCDRDINVFLGPGVSDVNFHRVLSVIRTHLQKQNVHEFLEKLTDDGLVQLFTTATLLECEVVAESVSEYITNLLRTRSVDDMRAFLHVADIPSAPECAAFDKENEWAKMR